MNSNVSQIKSTRVDRGIFGCFTTLLKYCRDLYPSQALIAAFAECSTRQVIRRLKVLVKANLIRKEYRHRQTCRYTLISPLNQFSQENVTPSLLYYQLVSLSDEYSSTDSRPRGNSPDGSPYVGENNDISLKGSSSMTMNSGQTPSNRSATSPLGSISNDIWQSCQQRVHYEEYWRYSGINWVYLETIDKSDTVPSQSVLDEIFNSICWRGA